MAKKVVCKNEVCKKYMTPTRFSHEKHNNNTGQLEAYVFKCPSCYGSRVVTIQEAKRQGIV